MVVKTRTGETFSETDHSQPRYRGECTGKISEFRWDCAAQWLSTNDVFPAFYSLQGTNLGECRGLVVFGAYLSSVEEVENFD